MSAGGQARDRGLSPAAVHDRVPDAHPRRGQPLPLLGKTCFTKPTSALSACSSFTDSMAALARAHTCLDTSLCKLSLCQCIAATSIRTPGRTQGVSCMPHWSHPVTRMAPAQAQ